MTQGPAAGATTRIRLSIGLILFAGAAPLRAQTDKQEPRFTERVEINIRTILAFVTDAGGKPIEGPILADDIEVREDGVPAKVLGVDPMRPVASSLGQSAPVPKPATDRSAIPPQSFSQVLYVDVTLLQPQSPKKIADMTLKNLESLLANGPLEIVLADPETRTILESTTDVVKVRAALAVLARSVGRNRVGDLRLQFLRQTGPLDAGEGSRNPKQAALMRERAKATESMRARQTAREEIQTVAQPFEILEKWADRRVDRRPTVLYLANDGFDFNPLEFYTNSSKDFGDDAQVPTQLSRDEISKISEIVARASNRLANQSIVTVALAIGGADTLFANAAEMGRRSSSASIKGPVFAFVRPLEPLRAIADVTGGDLLKDDRRFGSILDRLSRAVTITYRMEGRPDGKPHKLEVRSRRKGIVIRAASSVVARTPEMTASVKSVAALGTASDKGALPVEIGVQLLEIRKNSNLAGALHISVDLADIAETLERIGPGRVRVTIAVQAEGRQPFVHQEERDLTQGGEGTRWIFDLPLQWPPEARRIAVTVEELKTGTTGAASAELPKPD